MQICNEIPNAVFMSYNEARSLLREFRVVQPARVDRWANNFSLNHVDIVGEAVFQVFKHNSRERIYRFQFDNISIRDQWLEHFRLMGYNAYLLA